MSAPQIVSGGAAAAASSSSHSSPNTNAKKELLLTDPNAPKGMLPTESYQKRVLISRLEDALEPDQWKNREALEETKRRAGITHKLLDQWIYKFLENKHFDVNETVAKLERRLAMERNEMGSYSVDDIMRACMKAGVVRFIGEDRSGRTALYFVTARDFPKSSERKMRTANFDMWLGYACRMRARDCRCGITMLINQSDASFWSNTDMTFQSNIALRIAKFYPNVVEKAYVCNMSATLSAIARPVLAAFPKAISDHIFVFSESEVKNGKMLEYFEREILPKELGGVNDTNNPANFQLFSDTVEAYYSKIKKAIGEGRSVKEWEMEQALEECAKIEELEKKAFGIEQRKEEKAMAAAAAAASSSGSGGGLSSSIPDGGGFVSAASYRHMKRAATSKPSAAPDVVDTTPPTATPQEGAGAEHELESCVSDDSYFFDSQNASGSFGYDYEDDGSDLDENERQVRVQSRRLHVIQTRRLLRDEAYFRASLVDLYWYQIRAIRNYYFGRSAHDEDGGAGGGGEEGEEELASPGGRLLLGLPSTPHGSDGSPTMQRPPQRNVSALAANCPRSFQGLFVGFLIVLGSIIAAFFFVASLFLIMGVSALLVLMFINVFSGSGAIFPMGLGMLLLAHQGILIASRGFDLAAASLRGEILPPLRWLVDKECCTSTGWGLIVQFLLYFVIVMVQFIVFVVSAVEDPIVGLQGLFAVGLYACLIIILIAHVFFPFGVGTDETALAVPGSKSGSFSGRNGHGSGGTGSGHSRRRSMAAAGGGGDPSAPHRMSRINQSIYFFFDITETPDEEQVGDASGGFREVAGRLPTSSLVLTLIPSVLSVAFGLAFILEQSTVFLILALVTTLGAGFTLTHFMAGRLKTLTANLSRSTIWIGTLVWSFTYWSLGLIDAARTDEKWTAAIAGLLVAYVILAFLTSTAQEADEATDVHRLVFRLAYIMLAVAVLAGIVTLFITNWVLGIFSIIFLVHGVACFYRQRSHGPAAMLLTAIVVMCVLTAEILFASNIQSQSFSASDLYFVSRRPPTGSSGGSSSGDGGNKTSSGSNEWEFTKYTLQQNQTTAFSYDYQSSASQNNYVSEQYSLCQRVWRIPGGINMRVPDFALFAKLSYSRELNTSDVEQLLPQWELVKRSQPVGSGEFVVYDAYRDRTNNNTIVTVRGRSDSFWALIKTVSLWSESIALLPFVAVLPTDWTASVVGGVSDVAQLFDPTALQLVRDLEAAVVDLQNETENVTLAAPGAPRPEMLLVGHSVGGSIAAAVASRLQLRTISFSAPGLLYSQLKFEIDSAQYERWALNVRTSNDALGVIDSAGPNQQMLTCKDGADTCSSIDFPLCDLTWRCDVGKDNVTLSSCENFRG